MKKIKIVAQNKNCIAKCMKLKRHSKVNFAVAAEKEKALDVNYMTGENPKKGDDKE